MVNISVVHGRVNSHFTSCVKLCNCTSFTFIHQIFHTYDYHTYNYISCHLGPTILIGATPTPLNSCFFTICFQDIFGIFSIHHFKEFHKSFFNTIMLSYMLWGSSS
jgi:hypothetical protein